MSLTTRVTMIVIGCLLVLTAATVAGAWWYARLALGHAFDAALEGRAMSTLALVRYRETPPFDLLFDASLLPPSDPAHPDLFQIREAEGRVLAQSQGQLPPALASGEARYADFGLGGVPYRAITLRDMMVLDAESDVRFRPRRVTVVYAASLLDMQQQLRQLGLSIVGISLLLLAAASAAASWGVRRSLAPLHQLASAAGRISVDHWSFDPPANATLAAELRPVVRSIEDLVDRLKESFLQQRRFTSDAAHELKTSVAIVKSSLQSIAQWPGPEAEYRASINAVLNDCIRLEDLLSRMLYLARLEQASETRTRRELGITELTSTCEAAVHRAQALARERNIGLRLAAEGDIHISADPVDLEMIWINLLENAVRYSPSGATVAMRVAQNGTGTANVYVEDSGPGIPPEELPHIFERFHRGDPSRTRATGGFGLGLAICHAVVTSYGGRIEASNRREGGARIRVQLPIAGNGQS